MTPTIEIDGLSVRLGGRPAIIDLSARLAEPGVVALIGPNGAGKSTLLRSLAGLLPVDRGTIRVDGLAQASMTTAERARVIAYLPQDRPVHWPLPVRAIVALGRLPHGGPRRPESPADRAAIDRALQVMDLVELAGRPVLELSGGERARVLIARALAQQPRILLADEPAAGLDPAHQWGLHEALQKAAAAGMRVLIATHDLALAMRFASEVVLLDRGRLVARGTPTEVLTRERLAAVYGIAAELVQHGGATLIAPTGLAR